ncbi:hypothetical protein Cgig2_026456 [Carnegiea gigantea]|uniref:Uncharacterized protein n=1 Tax=Carnegiea gigantea TaxID=171969 RepID=A0A9Q1KAW2_9CARY|nr:hypothetical protein Cgig2_026456 [Carnegiea gigantea]
MTDIGIWQVSEQVKKAMEVVSSMRTLPAFDYVPAASCKSSHMHAPNRSYHRDEEERELARLDRDKQSRGENYDWSIGMDAQQSSRPTTGRPAKLTTTSTPYVTHSQRMASFEEQDGHHHVGLFEETQVSGERNRPRGTSHFGFRGKEVNPTRMIILPMRFGHKAKARNLEVDFLPTLHKVKAVIASYLLQVQFKAMMKVWASCKETSEWPENATLLASGHWWDDWLSVDSQDLHIKVTAQASSSPV